MTDTVGTVAQLAGLVVVAGIFAILLLIIHQTFVSRRNREDQTRDERYRTALAEATSAQQRTEERLGDVSARLAEVEKLLRDVG